MTLFVTVIEIKGGQVINIFAEKPANVVLVDWDSIEEAKASNEEPRGVGKQQVRPLSEMDLRLTDWILFEMKKE